jgi:hypothetical protein
LALVSPAGHDNAWGLVNSRDASQGEEDIRPSEL